MSKHLAYLNHLYRDSFLTNNSSRNVLKQFGFELKNLLDSIISDLGVGSNAKSLKSMSAMIEELLLVISVNDKDCIKIENESFNIKNMCDEVYNICAAKIEQKNIDYIQTIAPELERVNISSQRAIIKQIMLSLVTNALLVTKNGQIKVECMFGAQNKSHIKVSVSDEGEQINKKIINKLNKPSDPNDSSNFALSKMLTEKLGGKIWVSNNHGTGNTVSFSFDADYEVKEESVEDEIMDISDYSSSKDCINMIPSIQYHETPFKERQYEESKEIELELAPLIKAPAAAVENEISLADPNCPNILLVDDNYFNIEVLQSLIEVQLNFNCDSAFNGQEAVSKVKERYNNTSCNDHYRFIFMDINMPIMDGYAASSEIKKFLKKEAIKKNQNFNNIPTKIFAVTAQKEVIENEQKLFDGIILKPISIEGLRVVLQM